MKTPESTNDSKIPRRVGCAHRNARCSLGRLCLMERLVGKAPGAGASGPEALTCQDAGRNGWRITTLTRIWWAQPTLRHSRRALSRPAAGRAGGAFGPASLRQAAPRKALRAAATGHSERGQQSAPRGAPGPGIHRRRNCAAREAPHRIRIDRRRQQRAGHDDDRCGCGRGDNGPARRCDGAWRQNARSSRDDHAALPRMCWRTGSSPPPAMSALSETRPYFVSRLSEGSPGVCYEKMICSVGSGNRISAVILPPLLSLLAQRL